MKKIIIGLLFLALAVVGVKRIKAQSPTNIEELREAINQVLDNFRGGEEVFGGEVMEPRDVFGTKSGTSTSPVTNYGTIGYPSWPNSNFSDMALNDTGYGTTSKPMLLSGQTEAVLFTFDVLTASTSAEGGSYFSYDIFGSNDNYCTTTATSTTDSNYDSSGTVPIVSEINWSDIGTAGTRISGSVNNPSSATSTARFIDNVLWQCLKVDLRGASTTLLVQMREKIK